MQRMSVSTALDETSAAAWRQATDATRVKTMALQTTVRPVLEKFVAELFGRHMAVIIRQVVLREVWSMLDPAAFAFLSEKRGVNRTISLGLRGFGKMATSANCADFSGNGRRDLALVWADTFMVQEDVQPSKAESGYLSIVDGIVFDEWIAPLLDETPEVAKVIGTGAIKKITVCNEPTSNDSSPEKGSSHETNGTADWVLTAAKGKEQDDDDEDDDDDDDDDDDYEEEEEGNNDNKLEPGDDEEDVEGEDEEGEEEAGEEDGEDDGEAEDNGENDDGEEEGEEEDDVEGEEDGDEDGEEEQEEDEEDGEEEDPEDEDEDEVDGESEEDIEDLEPPKKKRK